MARRQHKAKRQDKRPPSSLSATHRLQQWLAAHPALPLKLCLLLAATIIIYRSAWISDDAYITNRVVQNFWQGYGLRWNICERVCAYTNPLMMLCMLGLYPFTGEFYYTGVIFCMVVSLAAISIFLFKLTQRRSQALMAVAALLVSKAFVDYTTSGLENCLLFICLAGLYWLVFCKDPSRDLILFFMAVFTSLLMLSRMDAVLFAFPLLLVAWWSKRTVKRIALILAGLTPFLAWEIFAIIYYGRILPNTAYAKLNTGLDLSFYLSKALLYYKNTILADPVTLPVIFGAIILAMASRRRYMIAAASGVVLYLLYIFRVGGDFMAGRFFAAPFFAATMLWCLIPLPKWRPAPRQLAVMAAVALVLVGFLHPLNPLRTGVDYNVEILPQIQKFQNTGGIADERGFYYGESGLLRAPLSPCMPTRKRHYKKPAQDEPYVPVTLSFVIGFQGAFSRPETYIIDRVALADPLLAMAPARRDRNQRIGHMHRHLPPQYIESRLADKNLFKDTNLRQLYDALQSVHSGPIWSRERWRHIWRINTGQYDHLIDKQLFQHPPPQDLNKIQKHLKRYRRKPSQSNLQRRSVHPSPATK